MKHQIDKTLLTFQWRYLRRMLFTIQFYKQISLMENFSLAGKSSKIFILALFMIPRAFAM